MGEKVAVGIDLGGTKLLGALVDAKGAILARKEEPTNASRGPEAVVAAMAAVTVALEEAGKKLGHEPVGVGVGVPGPIHPETGVIWAMPNMGPGWKRYPVKKKLEEALPGRRVATENDANAAMLGEAWIGAAKGSRDAVLLTLGTGVGGGVITGGVLVRGANGVGAELGHLIVERGGRACGCGARGCLEQYASGTGVGRSAQEAMGPSVTAHDVVSAARGGDPIAKGILEQAGSMLGTGIISFLHILNPDVIVIGGGFGTAAFDLLLPIVKREIEAGSFEASREGLSIAPARLGADAGAVGAARSALGG